MRPADCFRFCPRCAVALAVTATPLRCPACGFVYFFNPTVAAAAYLFDTAHRCLLIRRAKDPAKGKLAVPGGFIDIGETAEAGLRREVVEEVGITYTGLRYLGSWTNEYFYAEVTYPVVDLIFAATAVNPEAARALDGVAELEWRLPADIDAAELAFPSLKSALAVLRSGVTSPTEI
jgi:ADP-ribose pyrophosphatase YjhB (NUDIX family)